MSRHLMASRTPSIERAYSTTEPVLVDVTNGRLTLVMDDGDRIQFDATELLGVVEQLHLADQRTAP